MLKWQTVSCVCVCVPFVDPFSSKYLLSVYWLCYIDYLESPGLTRCLLPSMCSPPDHT